MALIKVEFIEDSFIWGIWKIEETEKELTSELESKGFIESFVGINNAKKRLQTLASRVLLKALLEKISLVYNGIIKDASGKPFLHLENFHISISHSDVYCTAIVHYSRKVGIDIERIRSKLLKVANKFLSSEEQECVGDSLNKLCIFWCVKEVIYKAYGNKYVSLKNNIKIKEIKPLQGGGECIAELQQRGHNQEINVKFIKFLDYYIAYNIN